MKAAGIHLPHLEAGKKAINFFFLLLMLILLLLKMSILCAVHTMSDIQLEFLLH